VVPATPVIEVSCPLLEQFSPPPRVGAFHPFIPPLVVPSRLGARVTQRDAPLSDHSDHAEAAGDQLGQPVALSGLNHST